MVRTRNKTAGLVKNITSSGFYWLINHISDVHFESNASDFFAISRHVAQVLKDSYREKVRFLRGYVQNVGFKKTTIEYEARARVAGESKYSIKKLFVFSINTILCFSNMPLKLGIYAGIFSALLGFAVMIYTLLTRRGAPSGYATIVVLLCFMFAEGKNIPKWQPIVYSIIVTGALYVAFVYMLKLRLPVGTLLDISL